MSALRPKRPSPALLVAALALFVGLGGTVWAANRIDGHRIKPKSLPGNRVAVGSLPGNRLVPGSIRGDQVRAGSLGRVPNAAHAEAADTAKSAGTAIHADAATDAGTVNGYRAGCEPGTRAFAGACWGTRTQPAANANEAATACGRQGGELPRALALKAFGEQPGVVLDLNGEWSGEIAGASSENEYSVLVVSSSGVVNFKDYRKALPYRCVIPLLH